MNRRNFLNTCAAGMVALPCSSWAAEMLSVSKKSRYKIAVIDLMILKRQKLSALPLAGEIGADGLEVDMGGLGDRPTFDNKLADPAVRQQYLDKAKELNLEICSLAMTGFYAQSFAKRDGAEKMVGDCIETMKLMMSKQHFCRWAFRATWLKTRNCGRRLWKGLKR
jgi:L-ribulose-5-phosphate 3-epimerase